MAERRGLFDHEQIAWEDSADARRVIGVDTAGSPWSASNPLPVLPTTEPIPASTFIEFQSVTGVPSSTETTVLTFTVSGAAIRLTAIGGEGTAFGEWFIYVNTVLVAKKRTFVLTDFEMPMYEKNQVVLRVENG